MIRDLLHLLGFVLYGFNVILGLCDAYTYAFLHCFMSSVLVSSRSLVENPSNYYVDSCKMVTLIFVYLLRCRSYGAMVQSNNGWIIMLINCKFYFARLKMSTRESYILA